jgi:hypothetical protein
MRNAIMLTMLRMATMLHNYDVGHIHHPTPPALPQAELCRAFGLAAVAAELNLQIEMLEPKVAEAVKTGAAVLFLSGYGPKGIHSRSRRPFDWDDTRNRVRRDVLRSRRLARQATETGAAIHRGDNILNSAG